MSSVSIDEFVAAPKARGFARSGGERKGSRRKVVLSDGSTIKWWNGEWRFSKVRWNSKVATSLNRAAMCKAIDEGREAVDIERYTDFKKFMDRMVPMLGSYEFLRIVQFIKGA